MNIKIDHIALYCLDLETMKTFFIKHFGCQPNDMYHIYISPSQWAAGKVSWRKQAS